MLEVKMNIVLRILLSCVATPGNVIDVALTYAKRGSRT